MTRLYLIRATEDELRIRRIKRFRWHSAARPLEATGSQVALVARIANASQRVYAVAGSAQPLMRLNLSEILHKVYRQTLGV